MGSYAPPPMSGRRARNISDLILRQGDIAAQRAARSGEIWGRAFSDVGNIAAGAIQEHQERKAITKRGEALVDFISNLPDDPEAILQRATQIFGPEGVSFARNVMDYRSTVQKAQQGEAPTFEEFRGSAEGLARMYRDAPEFIQQNWGDISQTFGRGAKAHLGLDLQPEWQDDYGPALESFLPDKGGPQPGTFGWFMGLPEDQRAEALGAREQWEGAGRAQASPAVGSFEDYLTKRFGPQPTPQQITQARQTYEASGRKPEQPIGEAGTTLAQGIANYGIRPSAYLLRSREGQQIMGEVMRLNPTYDQTKYDARNKLRADFTSGKTGNNIDALNTAVDHLNTLKELGEGLQNSDVQMVNAAVNKARTAFGDPRVTNLRTAATAVESEIASLLKKTGATDQEINAWRANFSADMSPRQFTGAINTALRIMRGRERALQHRWQVGMAVDRDYPIYGDEQTQILDGLGYFGTETQSEAPGPGAKAVGKYSIISVE